MDFDFSLHPIILKSLQTVFTIALFAVVIKIFNVFVKKIFQKMIDKTPSLDGQKQLATLRTILTSTVDLILIALLLFHILNKFGVDIRPLLATAGVVGVAIGFGSKRLVEDILTGITLILDGQLRVGDVVKVQGITGRVEKINVRLVVLRDIEGTTHFFRNSMIDIVSNYTRNFSYAVFDIPVSYNSNIDHVTEVLKEIFAELKSNKEFKKYIKDEIEILGLDKFQDSAITIKARIKTSPGLQWQITRGFNKLVKERFEKEGIEIPFPQRVITHKNPA